MLKKGGGLNIPPPCNLRGIKCLLKKLCLLKTLLVPPMVMFGLVGK